MVHRLRKLNGWIPHLRDLHVGAIYIGPLFESSRHGYDTIDYRMVDRRLGDQEDFKVFVRSCHEAGIRVVVDGVFNHTGREFFAFRDIQKNREQSRYKDWYKGINFGWDSAYHDGFSYETWRGSGDLVNLNLRNPEVKDYLFDVIRFWIDTFDIDGIRLDCADCLDFDFLREMRHVVLEKKPDFWLMGEVIHGDYARWANPEMLHSVTNYELNKGLWSGHESHNYFEIAHTIRRQFDENGGIYRGRVLYSFADNHDVSRVVEKLSDKKQLFPLYTLLYTLPGDPSIYYGSEWGIGGRKEDGDWGLRPQIDLEKISQNPPVPGLNEFLEKLGWLRQEYPVIGNGRYRELLLTNRQYAFARIGDQEAVVVAVNNDNQPAELWIRIPDIGDTVVDLLSLDEVKKEQGQLHVTLPADGCAVYLLNQGGSEAMKKKQAGKTEPKKVTAAAEPKKVTAAAEPKKVTAAAEPKKVTAAAEPKKVTAAAEPKKVTAAPEPKKVTAAKEPKKVAAAPELKKVTAAKEPKKVTVAPEPKKVTAAKEPKKKTAEKVPEKGPEFIGDLDQYLFDKGVHYDIYKKLGAHPSTYKGRKGIHFAVWAPHAAAVTLIGEFNGWNESNIPMEKKEPSGIWETFVESAQPGQMYKYLIYTQDGRKLYKADPYANQAEYRPGTASIIADLGSIKWTDGRWMRRQNDFVQDKAPISIYECHIGSWMRHPHGEHEDGFYNYRYFAHSITDYLLKTGYTHIELMGVAEHPFDGSWGYQVTGYYAPTSRYGTPEDFAYMVNYLHSHGIGVILDWVPAHFPKDAHGLSEFDGTPCYEYADPRKGEHPDWGTKVFDFGKSEVKNFLIANALYWIEEFHVDGLRVDAVASILYLDYGRKDGQWVPNKYGGNKNLEAIEFFKHLNSVVRGKHPGVMMIAEESTAWPKVTGRPEDDGLGFSMKWNMGWMHDFLEYMKLDPYFRKFNHNKLTFAMTYAYSEKYCLVLSHDEVVHLKCSMINKMPGLYDDKFANLKCGYTYMFGHPGKKLLFMGQDFAQEREWSEDRELDWFLLQQPRHRQMLDFVTELLHLYKNTPAMYDADCDPRGFEWINADDADRSIYSFLRHSEDGKSNLLFVINFTPVARPDYRVGCVKKCTYRLVLDGDEARFGGRGTSHPVMYKAVESECDGKLYSFAYDLPAYGVAVFRY